jgi:hypothetical protein
MPTQATDIRQTVIAGRKLADYRTLDQDHEGWSSTRCGPDRPLRRPHVHRSDHRRRASQGHQADLRRHGPLRRRMDCDPGDEEETR